MSIYMNAEKANYVRTLFSHPSQYYSSYQENGTKYLKLRRELDEELQQQLNACAGEIFLCGIQPATEPEKIAEVAALLGEVYILRFKVHFSGASRGFAYLQYTDPHILPLALQKLPILFAALHLRTIKVCTSRNSSKLLLRKAFNMSPKMVYETLSKLTTFSNLVKRELSPGYFEYQIVFKCNEEAVHARREILKSIVKFGPKAIIMWDASCRGYNYKYNPTLLMKVNPIKKLQFRQLQNEHEMNKSRIEQQLAINYPQNFAGQENDCYVNAFSNMKLF